MSGLRGKERRIFEVMLIVVTVGMTYLLFQMGAYKLVILNLFFLPIVLSGYFLGRSSAGTLALLSVLAVTIVTATASAGMASFSSPVMMVLALTVWAGALGLTALLVGTLCDERAKTVDELHSAYVGVVEVLSKYLQNANPNVKTRSIRIAELSQAVGEELRLPRKDVDDIRVGALLYDLGNMEISTQVLSRAVDALGSNPDMQGRHTFSGMDLVHSLGSVLSGAVPLLLNQDDISRDDCAMEDSGQVTSVPLGAKVIRAVRAYDTLLTGTSDQATPQDVLRELRRDISGGYDQDVLDALGRCMTRSVRVESRVQPEPVHS